MLKMLPTSAIIEFTLSNSFGASTCYGYVKLHAPDFAGKDESSLVWPGWAL